MATNVQRTLRYLPANLFQNPIPDIFTGQTRFALAPDLDTFQQRARRVVARLPHGEYGIQVNMGINKWRRDKPASGINLANGIIRGEFIGYPGELTILYGDINKAFTAMKACMMDNKVVLHTVYLFNPVQCTAPYASKTRGRRSHPPASINV